METRNVVYDYLSNASVTIELKKKCKTQSVAVSCPVCPIAVAYSASALS